MSHTGFYVFSSLRCIARGGIAGLYGNNTVFNPFEELPDCLKPLF